MRTLFVLFGAALIVSACVYSCSGPSDAEVESSQNALCLKWGAKWGTSDYINCRAVLAVNYQRQKQSDSDADMSGAAMVMGATAAANSGGRR